MSLICKSDLAALAATEYCLSAGLSFETAATTLKRCCGIGKSDRLNW
ncbi:MULTISPECIES: hypothetical protein [Aerosakkonema]